MFEKKKKKTKKNKKNISKINYYYDLSFSFDLLFHFEKFKLQNKRW